MLDFLVMRSQMPERVEGPDRRRYWSKAEAEGKLMGWSDDDDDEEEDFECGGGLDLVLAFDLTTVLGDGDDDVVTLNLDVVRLVEAVLDMDGDDGDNEEAFAVALVEADRVTLWFGIVSVLPIALMVSLCCQQAHLAGLW